MQDVIIFCGPTESLCFLLWWGLAYASTAFLTWWVCFDYYIFLYSITPLPTWLLPLSTFLSIFSTFWKLRWTFLCDQKPTNDWLVVISALFPKFFNLEVVLIWLDYCWPRPVKQIAVVFLKQGSSNFVD